MKESELYFYDLIPISMFIHALSSLGFNDYWREVSISASL